MGESGHASRLDLTRHGSSHNLPSKVCWEDTFQKVPDFIGAGAEKPCPIRFAPESGHSTLSWKRFSVQAEYRPLAHLAAIEHHPSRGKSIS